MIQHFIKLGPLSRMTKKMQQKLVSEAARRPTSTLKQLQKFLSVCGLHVIAILCILHTPLQRNMVARQNHFIPNTTSLHNSPRILWKNFMVWWSFVSGLVHVKETTLHLIHRALDLQWNRSVAALCCEVAFFSDDLKSIAS